MDGGFAKKEDIEQAGVAGGGDDGVCPGAEAARRQDRDPHQPLPGDSATIAEWRQRMGTPEAKEIYKERASTAECVNAISRNRGLRQFLCED